METPSRRRPRVHQVDAEGAQRMVLEVVIIHSELRGISKNFGAVQALSGVDLDVHQGQVTLSSVTTGRQNDTDQDGVGYLECTSGQISGRAGGQHQVASRATTLVSRRCIRIWPSVTIWTSSKTCSRHEDLRYGCSTKTQWKPLRKRRCRISR